MRAVAALVLLLALGLAGCGPSQPRSTTADERVSDFARTASGNPVYFGETLHDFPDRRDAAVALIGDAMAEKPSLSYAPLTFYVFKGPLRLEVPVSSPFDGATVFSTTSFYDPHSECVYLSWLMAGPVGQPSKDHFAIGNADYELANVRCHCESALLPKAH